MAWVIFEKTYNHDYRPEMGACQEFKASPEPQECRRVVADAAIAGGYAVEAKTPKKGEKPVANKTDVDKPAEEPVESVDTESTKE